VVWRQVEEEDSWGAQVVAGCKQGWGAVARVHVCTCTLAQLRLCRQFARLQLRAAMLLGTAQCLLCGQVAEVRTGTHEPCACQLHSKPCTLWC
jgi:hypothetical protein